jgi:hypothetical protein
MARCPSCDYPLPENRERLGARCSNCRDPLYEPVGKPVRPPREGESACAVHPANESVGTCSRCGNYLCETCRTRWREQVVCAACVSRALESREALPEQVRASMRQATLSLGLGIGVWMVTVPMFIILVLVAAAAIAAGTEHGVFFASVALCALFLIGPGVAVFGIGQAAAVLRARGSHMILATIGLILSSLYIGMMVGLLTFALWQS